MESRKAGRVQREEGLPEIIGVFVEIGGFQRISLMDYPGKITSIIFVTGCNARCPFCYTSDLVLKNYKKLRIYSEEEVLAKLEEGRKMIEAVDITGGEPTLQEGLEDFIKRCRDLGLLVKLDTNGTNPSLVKDFIRKGILDYIAMDIKTELKEDKYLKALGVSDSGLFTAIKKSIKLIMGSGVDYEFKTTVVPSLVELEDPVKIARQIKGANAYYLQQFLPISTIDPSFMKIKPYSKEELEKISKKITEEKLVKKAEVRSY